MKTSIKALLLLLASMSVGCARLVVLDPEQVAQKNSSDWNVKHAPQGAAPAATPAPSAPQAR